jgi:hypothetical protein
MPTLADMLAPVAPPCLARQWACVDQPARPWLRRADALDAFLIFSLFNYAYVFFFPYAEGVSQAPRVFFFAKYVVWLFVLAFVLTRGNRLPLMFDGLRGITCVFALAILFAHGMHLPQYLDPGDITHLGNLLIFVPLIVLLRYDHAQRLLDLLPPLMCLQVALSAVTMAAGVELWEDGAFVGLLSNPNSFALALNLAIFRILVRRRSFTALEVFQMALMAIGLVLSRSNSQLIIFVLGVGTIAVATGTRRLLFVGALIVTIPLGLILAWSLDLIATRVVIDAVVRASSLFGDGSFTEVGNAQLSLSVTLREQIHALAWQFVQQASVVEILFGDFEASRYYLMDSQYLMIAVNYGLLPLAVLLFLMLVATIRAWTHVRRTGEWFDLLALMAFSVTFLFSRVLYYFPINVLFFVCLVHAEAQTRTFYVPLAWREGGLRVGTVLTRASG